MANEIINHRALPEQTPDFVTSREMIGFAAQRLSEDAIVRLSAATA